MRKQIWRLLALCFALGVMLAAVPSALPSARAAADIVASGDCGGNVYNVTWTLDNKGTLTISGTGAMLNYSWDYIDNLISSTSPWANITSAITEIVVTNGVTAIGNYAFTGCDRVTKVTIANSVIKIGYSAFRRCSSLTRITLPNTISLIDDATFGGCVNLVNISLPDSLTSVGIGAFYGCEYLTKMTLPATVTNLGEAAFQGCTRLQSVTIPGEINILNASTFRDCPALTTVTLPDSLVIIKENAFMNCNALSDVYFTGSRDMWEQISIEDSNPCLESATIHYDTAVTSAYKINSVSVTSNDGKSLTTIPAASFLATVSVTNCTSGGSPVIFLAAYTAEGQYQGLLYVTVREPVGGTAEITLPVDNPDGKITSLKAFAVKSLSDLEMLGSPVSFPAE